MGTYDLNLKTIFDNDGAEIINRLFGEKVVARESTNLLVGVPRFADEWYRLEGNRYLHLEFQSTNDPTMGWRMANYRAAMAFQKSSWEKPVDLRQIVIYFGNGRLSMKRHFRESGLSFGFELYDVRELPHGSFDLDKNAFNVNLMVLLGEAVPESGRWTAMIEKACRLPNKSLRSSQLLKLEALAGLRGELGPKIAKEIEKLALELNIEHTTLARQVYDQGRREVWISTLVEDYGSSIENLRSHLDKLSAGQAKYVFDQARRGADLWDAYNAAERLGANVTPRP